MEWLAARCDHVGIGQNCANNEPCAPSRTGALRSRWQPDLASNLLSFFRKMARM